MKDQLPAKDVPSIFSGIDPDYLIPKIKAPYRLYRYEQLRSRYYLEFFKNGKSVPYISITSLVSLLIAKGWQYDEWLKRVGDKADVIRDNSAEYGTVFHKEALSGLVAQKYSFDFLDEVVDRERRWTQFHMLFHPEFRAYCGEWRYGFKKGLASFFQFVKDRVVEVIAVEIPVRSITNGYAGTADLVARIKFQKKKFLQ